MFMYDFMKLYFLNKIDVMRSLGMLVKKVTSREIKTQP